MSVALLRSQDVLLLCKLLVRDSNVKLRQMDLARELMISQSEVSTGIERLMTCHLLDLETKLPNKMMAIEFLESSIKFMFPAQGREYTLGIPTSIYAEPLAKKIVAKGMPLVWPSADGSKRGLGFEPIHESVPEAIKTDPKLYELLTVVDAVRSFSPGRVKEQASFFIRKMVLGGASE